MKSLAQHKPAPEPGTLRVVKSLCQIICDHVILNILKFKIYKKYKSGLILTCYLMFFSSEKRKRKGKLEILTRRFYLGPGILLLSESAWLWRRGLCSFGALANQTTGFVGVQSNLQSNSNYRSDNKRLEMDF